MNYAKAIELLEIGEHQELKTMLETELYLSQSTNKTSEKGKLSVLKRIIKSAGDKGALNGFMTIPDNTLYQNFKGVCDGYRAIRTCREYPLPGPEYTGKPIKLHDIITPLEYAVQIDVKKLKAAKAQRVERVKICDTVFNTKYIVDMCIFFDTDVIYLDKVNGRTLEKGYFKNEEGEDGLVLGIRMKQEEDTLKVDAA